MLSLVALFIVLNLLVLAPALMIGLSSIFSDEVFSYKKSFILCLQILFITLFVQSVQIAVSLYLPPKYAIVNVILFFVLFVVIISIIKSKFNTTVIKAIFIQLINIFFAVIVAFSFRHFICQAYKVPAGSNIPTILVGDYILANKYVYRFSSPERNDYIIFKFPKDEKIDYIKRIVALPHEEVEIVNKKIFINRQPVLENFIVHVDDNIKLKKQGPRDNFGPITVPKDSYFVLGDNRDNSFDSRFFGFIDKDKIRGKAEVIYFSYDAEKNAIRTERIGMKIE